MIGCVTSTTVRLVPAVTIPLSVSDSRAGRSSAFSQNTTGTATPRNSPATFADVIVDDVASLVLSQGHHSVDGLLRELEARDDLEVHGVGDCLAPRTVEEAVLEGLRVGTLV